MMHQLEIILDVFHFQGIVGKFRRQCLESDFNTGNLIKALIDDPHAALSQERQNFISVKNQITYAEFTVILPISASGHGQVIDGRSIGSSGSYCQIQIIHLETLFNGFITQYRKNFSTFQ